MSLKLHAAKHELRIENVENCETARRREILYGELQSVLEILGALNL